MEHPPGDVTQLLLGLAARDSRAESELLEVVYAELHRMADRLMRSERPDHTLQATALINEAYLHLVDQRGKDWKNRAHFFGVAALVMRRILVDYARTRGRDKRGGRQHKVSLDETVLITPGQSDEILALDEALSRLSQFDPRQSRVVELRFFGGLTEAEAAEVLGVATRTVKRDWAIAKAWLYGELHPARPS
jgi:RNA polymerase sigma-70 factor (ECF subfamily)